MILYITDKQYIEKILYKKYKKFITEKYKDF